MYYSYNDYLMHHGVKGMKWGVRHDPERVGRRVASPNKSGKRKHKSNAKKWVKRGAIVAAGVLAVGGAVYLSKSGKFDKLTKLGQNSLKSEILNAAKTAEKSALILGNPDLSVEVKDGVKRIKNFNPNFRHDASNCRQATSEFLCKKSGINCIAKPAKIINGQVKTGSDPHDLFPNSLVHNEVVPKKVFDSEKEFNSYLENRFKTLCDNKDGFGSLTINLNENMRHNLSWEVKNGRFNIIDADGVINRSYYSTFNNNVRRGYGKAREIEFFKAEGDINMDAVNKQVIRK